MTKSTLTDEQSVCVQRKIQTVYRELISAGKTVQQARAQAYAIAASMCREDASIEKNADTEVAEILDIVAPEKPPVRIEKLMPVTGYPGGKSRQASMLVRAFPEHRTYVEPFCGMGSVFLRKEPSDAEVINDGNPDVAQFWRDIQSLTDEEIEHLKRRKLVGSKDQFKKWKDSSPSTKLDRITRMVYLRRFAAGANPEMGFMTLMKGTVAKAFKRIAKVRDRLKGVTILNDDYKDVIKRYDSDETVFYLDPPYSDDDSEAGRLGQGQIDLKEFRKIVGSLKGTAIISFWDTKAARDLFSGMEIRGVAVRGMAPGTAMARSQGPTRRELVISNRSLKRKIGKSIRCLRAHDAASIIRKMMIGETAQIDVKNDPTARMMEPIGLMDIDSGLVYGIVKMSQACKTPTGWACEVEPIGIMETPERVFGASPGEITGFVRIPDSFGSILKSHGDLPVLLDATMSPSVLCPGGRPRGMARMLRVASVGADYLGRATSQAIVRLHDRIHDVYRCWFFGTSRDSIDGCTRSDLVAAHRDVVMELRHRGIEPGEDLGCEKIGSEDEPKPVDGVVADDRPSGRVTGPRLFATEVLKHMRSASLRMPVAAIVGGMASQGFTDSSIEILIQGGLDASVATMVKTRIRKMLPPDISKRVRFVTDGSASGPIEAHVPIYALGLTRFPDPSPVRMAKQSKSPDAVNGRIHDGTLIFEIRGEEVSAEIDARDAEDVTVEFGLGSDESVEGFVSGCIDAGIYDLRKSGSGWSATRAHGFIPSIVASPARPISEYGSPCIPESMAKELHEELRFWEIEDDIARRNARDMAIDSGVFEGSAVVDGEFRFVSKRLFMSSPVRKSSDRFVIYRRVEPTKKAAFESSMESYCLSVGGMSFMATSDPFSGLHVPMRESSFDPEDPALFFESQGDASEIHKSRDRFSWKIENDSLSGILSVERTDGANDRMSACFSPDGIQKSSSSSCLTSMKCLVIKRDEEERIATGIVLEPETIDSQEDIESEDEIRKAAFDFMRRGAKIKLQHKVAMSRDEVYVIENYVAPVDFEINGEKVKKGSWVMSVKIEDDDIWDSVKTGKLTGFSVGGLSKKVKEQVDVDR